jgi:succinylglutamic semialdehyde dehydrogenase
MVPLTDSGDRFLDQLIDTTTRIVVGDPTGDVFMGPVISDLAAQRLLDGYGNIVDAGAEILLPMNSLPLGNTFLSPGIVDATGLALPDEEHFGPLLTVYRYRDFEEAIELANHTRFGLAAGIFTEDPALHEQFWEASTAGIVNWNRPLTGASSAAPFGGTGSSGNHRPSAYYAADYVAYPVASLESPELERLDLPGLR